MGEFFRKPSKVWWSTFPDEDSSKTSGFLDWGNGIDLSGIDSKNHSGKIEDKTAIGPLNKSKLNNTVNNSINEKSVNRKQGNNLSFREESSPNVGGKWDRSRLENSTWANSNSSDSRGSSSSPSQGSHKSQDSGFSDSEIQHNNSPSSPQDSPDLSKRLETEKEGNKREEEKENNYSTSKIQNSEVCDETVIKFETLKPKEKNVSSQAKDDEADLNKYTTFLETAFDGEMQKSTVEVSVIKVGDESEFSANSVVSSTSCLKQSRRRNLIKTNISRPKNEEEKSVNQFENQLESSFKLPKKILPNQNVKLSNSIITQFQTRPHDDSYRSFRSGKSTNYTKKDFELPGKKKPNSSAGSVTLEKLKSNDKTELEGYQSESELFRKPKRVVNEESVKGSNNFLDLIDIEGPPICSSTPKSSKTSARKAPGAEKTVVQSSTLATIRKLKGLSEKKVKSSMNLLASFSRNSEKGNKKEPTASECQSSVKHWLFELRSVYEAEIMTTLQSKSLATDLTRQVTSMATTTSETVRKLHLKTKIISTEFSKLCQNIKSKKYKQVAPLVQSLIGHIKEFIRDYIESKELQPSGRKSENLKEKSDSDSSVATKDLEITEIKVENFSKRSDRKSEESNQVSRNPHRSKKDEVLQACEQLRALTIPRVFNHEAVDSHVSRLGLKFTEVVDMLLLSHIQALVHVLEEPRTELALRTAISALTTLGLESSHLSHLVARCGGVRALLAVCLEARASAVRESSLRALATVCCISETIRQFEQAGGVEILADLLADDTRSETELSETAAVLAQITAPWVEDNHSVNGLGQYLSTLVKSLTRIIKEYKSSETLLLSAAALANLTFMEPRTVWPLLENQTAGILLSAVRKQGPKVSVFIQEQAATVIANMSSVPECRKHLAENRAVVALLCFLQIRHSPLQRAPEITAAERVQQKSAIALSRLCSDATVARQIIELQGITRLVRLCKEERERNHSDGVLVACLAALRKIVASCGTEAMEELNAMELVEPRLFDSFLLYSSRQESYV